MYSNCKYAESHRSAQPETVPQSSVETHTVKRRPSALAQADRRPSTVNLSTRPSAVHCRHSTISHPLSTLDHRPSTIGRPLSTLNHRSSTVDTRPSTINHRPSTVDTQPLVIHCRHSTINHQPSAVHCRHLTVHCQHSTVHCQHSTVHCQHSTVYCRPSTRRHSTIGRPLSTVHINTQPSTVDRQRVNTQPSMLTVNTRHSYRYINRPFPLHGQVSHLVAPQLLQPKTRRSPKSSADAVVPHRTHRARPLARSGPRRFTQGSFRASRYLLLHTFTLGSTPSSLTLAFYYHMLPPHPLFTPATKDDHLLTVKRLLTSMCNGT